MELARASLVTAGVLAALAATLSWDMMNLATTSIGLVCQPSNSSLGVVI